jgi:hypothetical protein
LEQNLPILEGMETRHVLELEAPNAAHYISKMRNISTWGGAIEIQCACNIWNARIIVHDIRSCHSKNNKNNNNKIEFIPLQTSNTSINANAVPHSHPIEFHLEWSGGHYEPRK